MTQAFKSATLKLTAYYMAIIVVICMLFSTAIYHFANNELRSGLYSQSQRIVNQYPGFDFNAALRSERDYREGTHRILRNLAYLNASVLIFAGFASYGLAKRTLRPIEESHEQQKRFTADVSHELRTPLTALHMSTEVALLDEKATKEELRTALRENLDESGKMEALINNLLRLTRLEAAEMQKDFTDLQMSEIVDAAIAEVQPQFDARGITIDNSISPENAANYTVHGDQASLKQLFSILLENAAKYSPEHASVEVAATQTGDTTSLQIIDKGIGIDAAALPHIFDRFYRADAARTRSETSGFGLGLSIAKMIADVHCATIHITSATGHGTTVQVDLPRNKT
jgi:two-component system sensor histidine kinase CiaH